jgi:hypothetical protein
MEAHPALPKSAIYRSTGREKVAGEKRWQDSFCGSSAWAEGRLEVQVPGDCLHPILISKGRAPTDTVANGLEFRGGQRPVDPLGPTR